MDTSNNIGCARTIGIIAGIATIIGVVIAILAWLLPFTPIGPSPLAPKSTESINSNPPTAVQIDSSPPRIAQTISFTVAANQFWQDTGVTLNAGDIISIEYSSGLWDWTSEYPDFDAQGDPNPQNTCDYIGKLVAPGESPGTCAVPIAQVGALVGKIGDDAPFLVGRSYSRTVSNSSSSGTTLYLMTNDVYGGFGDNAGQIKVEILVSVP